MCEDCEKMIEEYKIENKQIEKQGRKKWKYPALILARQIEEKLACKKAHLKDLEEIENYEYTNPEIKISVHRRAEKLKTCIKILDAKT